MIDVKDLSYPASSKSQGSTKWHPEHIKNVMNYTKPEKSQRSGLGYPVIQIGQVSDDYYSGNGARFSIAL